MAGRGKSCSSKGLAERMERLGETTQQAVLELTRRRRGWRNERQGRQKAQTRFRGSLLIANPAADYAPLMKQLGDVLRSGRKANGSKNFAAQVQGNTGCRHFRRTYMRSWGNASAVIVVMATGGLKLRPSRGHSTG